MTKWSWASASCIGTSHQKSGTRLQDAKYCSALPHHDSSTFIVIISDGAGSAAMGGQGASLACRTAALAARRHFLTTSKLPSQTDIEMWIDDIRDKIFLAAKTRNLTPRDFAATLILAISNGYESLVAHIGDGCVVFQSASDSNWIAPIWPDHGEYASTTFFVTDDIAPKLNISYLNQEISAVVAFSDGIERLALDFSGQIPHSKFFDAISRPLINMSQLGRSIELSQALHNYLNSQAINDRTDDDKTLVIAVPK